MNMKTLYILLGLALVAVIVFFIMSGDSGKPGELPAGMDQTQLPSGHPPVGGGEATPPGMGQPSKSNVRPEFLHMVEKLKEKVKKNPRDTSGVLELARLLTDAHQFDEALPLYERYLKADPRNTSVMLDQTNCYFGLGNHVAAARVTKDILRVEPKNTAAMYNLGAIYATQGRKEEAKEAWNELIRKFPKSEEAAQATKSLSNL